MVQAMAQVLEGLLDRSGLVVPPAQIQVAVQTLTPAALSLRQHREQLPAGLWDGLVHRRCQLREVAVDAAAQPAGSAANPAEGAGESAQATLEVLARRGAWELLRATSQHRTPSGAPLLVEHELARPLTDQRTQETRPAVGRAAGAAADGAAFSPHATGGAGRAGRAVSSATASAALAANAANMLRVTAADVAAWAQATADSNAIHLQAGRAQALGLAAGEGQVVAHGLLLAAISLAFAPAHSPSLQLRFTHALAVDQGGTPVELGPGGELHSGGLMLLKRREL
ncbi:Uncharacterised protein [Actinomyces bovis]|uniref:MaoC-like domain-containing protein n=2 Tax=Actinomyces bovis TaxID=1658 RepID=A0ABY1VNL1_9ACTO|nr:Uncharacterised protein [Actinomyces bovis]VEG52557.1 Uncharacterised protein [Actinomyces israelii]